MYFLVEIFTRLCSSSNYLHVSNSIVNDGYNHHVDSGMGVYEDGTQEWIDPSAMRTDV